MTFKFRREFTLRVVGLILVSVLTYGSSAPAETGSRGCQPEFGAPKPSARSKGVRARRFGDAFAAFEAETDVDRRLDALGEALIEYRRAERNLQIGRMFTTRLKAAKGALYRHLFDPDARVRWGAAYAVAALQNESLPVEVMSLAEHRSDAHEVKVKHELRSYLRSHHNAPFTYFRVNKIRPVGSGWMVDVHVVVSDELRVPFDTGPFKVELPPWITPTPTLVITATDYFSRVSARAEVTGTRDHGLRIEGTFTLEVPRTVGQFNSPIFVNMQLDGHALEQKILTSHDYLP